MPSSDNLDDPGILGLDNVRLDLPLAGMGSRILAMSLDQLALLALILLLFIGTLTIGTFVDSRPEWVFAFLGFGIFALQWGYFSVCEIVMDGKTPGKLAIGLRTVSHLGGQPSAGAILTRNFLRTFDLLVGLPIMAFDRRSRRLGDLVASTLVVHDRREPSLHLGHVPESWSAREIAVVESFLCRADEMESDVALELAARLLAWLKRRDPGSTAAAEGQDSLTALRTLLQPEWTS